MYNIKKSKKITILIITIISVFIVIPAITLTYINSAYSHINKDIRTLGFISDILVRFDSKESLKALSKNTPTIPFKIDENVALEEIYINTNNNLELRLLVMKPSAQYELTNAVIWFHGGGYAMKTPEDELSLMQKFVLRNDAVVISPDYTLSIDEPYPAALNDAYDTLLWVKDNSEFLNIDEEQIFIGGGSAGGGLTAALSLYARDKAEVNIAFQMPLYPMLDHTTVSTDNDEHMLVWDLKRNEIAWEVYLGELYNTNDIPIYASANTAVDYTNLPPTYTFVGTEDPFYEDTLEYIDKLSDDGVTAVCDIYNGAYHGFDVVATNAQITQDAWDNLLKAYDYAVENYRTLQP